MVFWVERDALRRGLQRIEVPISHRQLLLEIHLDFPPAALLAYTQGSCVRLGGRGSDTSAAVAADLGHRRTTPLTSRPLTMSITLSVMTTVFLLHTACKTPGARQRKSSTQKFAGIRRRWLRLRRVLRRRREIGDGRGKRYNAKRRFRSGVNKKTGVRWSSLKLVIRLTCGEKKGMATTPSNGRVSLCCFPHRRCRGYDVRAHAASSAHQSNKQRRAPTCLPIREPGSSHNHFLVALEA